MRPTDRPHSVYTANLRGLTNGPHLRAVPHPFLPRTRLFNDQFSFHPDRSSFARQSGCDPRALDMGEVETHLAALRKIIKGEG